MNSLQIEEMEYRRSLFKAAAKGDVRAQQELESEYHVRVCPPSTERKNNPGHILRLPKTKKDRPVSPRPTP